MLVYRALMSLAAPVLVAGALRRSLAGGVGDESLAERFGALPSRPEGRVAVWLHGASVGEVASARPLAARLLAERPDLWLLVTSNTPGGRDAALGWRMPRVAAALAPFDLRWCLRRAFDAVRPEALVIMENEIWPGRIAAAEARGVPVALVGARLSERSAARWRRARGLAGRVLGAVRLLSAQDVGSEARLLELGVPAAALGPRCDLKALYTAPGPDAVQPSLLPEGFRTGPLWLAASTHPGEEAAVIEAHLKARAARPGLRLILAPRHPRRGDAIAAALGRAGLSFARRSRGEAPGPQTDVFLADTLGEMPAWYGAAGIVFVGGSLEDRGGHTPHEPAAFGAAVLHGPHVANFAEAYARLAAAGGAREVRDAESLASAIIELKDESRRAELAARGRAALAGDGDLDALVTFMLAMLAAPRGAAPG